MKFFNKIKKIISLFFSKKKEMPNYSRIEKLIIIRKILHNTSLITKSVDHCIREIFIFNGGCRNMPYLKKRKLDYKLKAEKYISEYGNAENLYGEEICKRIVDFRSVKKYNNLFFQYVENFIKIGIKEDFVYLNEYILKNIHGDIDKGIKDSMELAYMKELYTFDKDVFSYYSDFRRKGYDLDWLYYYCEPWNGHSAVLEYNFLSYQFYHNYYGFDKEFPVPFRELHTNIFWHYRLVNKLPQTKEHIILTTDLYTEHLLNKRRSFLLYKYRRSFMLWYVFFFIFYQLSRLPIISTLVWNSPLNILGIIQVSIITALFEVFYSLPDGSLIFDLVPPTFSEYLELHCFWWNNEYKLSLLNSNKRRTITSLNDNFFLRSDNNFYLSDKKYNFCSNYKNNKNSLNNDLGDSINNDGEKGKSFYKNIKSKFLTKFRFYIFMELYPYNDNKFISKIIDFIYEDQNNILELNTTFTDQKFKKLSKELYWNVINSNEFNKNKNFKYFKNFEVLKIADKDFKLWHISYFDRIKNNMNKLLIWRPKIRKVFWHMTEYLRFKKANTDKAKKFTANDYRIEKTVSKKSKRLLHPLDKLNKFSYISKYHINLFLNNFKIWNLNNFNRMYKFFFITERREFSYVDFKRLLPVNSINNTYNSFFDIIRNFFVSYIPDVRRMNCLTKEELLPMLRSTALNLKMYWLQKFLKSFAYWFLVNKHAANSFIYFSGFESYLSENDNRIFKSDLLLNNKERDFIINSNERINNILKLNYKKLDLTNYNKLYLNTDKDMQERFLYALQQKYHFFRFLRSSRLKNSQSLLRLNLNELPIFFEKGFDLNFYIKRNRYINHVDFSYDYLNTYRTKILLTLLNLNETDKENIINYSIFKEWLDFDLSANLDFLYLINNCKELVNDESYLNEYKDKITCILNKYDLNSLSYYYNNNWLENSNIKFFIQNKKIERELIEDPVSLYFKVEAKGKKNLLNLFYCLYQIEMREWFYKNKLNIGPRTIFLELWYNQLLNKYPCKWENSIILHNCMFTERLDLISNLKSKYIHSNDFSKWYLYFNEKFLKNSSDMKFHLENTKFIKERELFDKNAIVTVVRTNGKREQTRIMYLPEETQLALKIAKYKFHPKNPNSIPLMWTKPPIKRPKIFSSKFDVAEWYEFCYLTNLRSYRIANLEIYRSDWIYHYPWEVRAELIRVAKDVAAKKL